MKNKKEEFKRYLAKIEDPNYQGGSWALPENATTVEKTKYELCEKVIRYKRNKGLVTEQLAKKMRLSKAETEDILHCRLDYFTLDRLTVHAGYLLSPSQTFKVIFKLESNRKEDSKSPFVHA